MTKNMLSNAALAALAAAGGLAATAGIASAQSTPSIQPMNGAPEIRDGQQRFKMRGRFQYDIINSDWDNNAEQGTRSYARRAFLGAQGRLSDRWRYKVDFVLNPGASDVSSATTALLCQNNTTQVITQRTACVTGETSRGTVVTAQGSGGGDDVAVDDAYLEYAGDFFSLVIGENNVTSPLEDRTSSLDIPFIERSSVINAFGYGRLAGIAYLQTGANWTAAVGVYGDSLNNADSNFNNDESMSISGRFTWAPLFEVSPDGYSLIHLGLVARERYIGDDAAVRYRTRPLNGRGNRHIDAGSAMAGERDTTIGVEFAAQYNQFGVTAEYHRLDGQETPAAGGSSYEFDGYYIDANWSLTGEPRAYRGNQGSFGAVVPSNPINRGGPGHWSVSARYDYLNLDDPAASSTSRGEQSAYALGLNWVPLDHVRFMLNYAETEMDRATTGQPDIDARVISLRTQFDF
jgi:phosphate-selective porin OprO/OprP